MYIFYYFIAIFSIMNLSFRLVHHLAKAIAEQINRNIEKALIETFSETIINVLLQYNQSTFNNTEDEK